MLEVLGHRVLVKPDPIEEKTSSGLIISYGDKELLHKRAMDRGTLVGVGPNAWKAFDDGQAWANAGDKVYYAKHAGKILTDPDTDEEYVLLNDEDIQCRIVEGVRQ